MKIKSNLNTYKHIFFIGIGGISLSGLAKWCLHNNINVSGSDLSLNHLTDKLELLGAKIYPKHSKKNIDKDVKLIVYTSAIKKNNPELIFAKKHNIPIMERAVFLNEIIKNYKNVISVAGMHGKTTTCGMLASVFINAKLNPTVHIGGECEITDGNFKIGNKNYFITEACEYKDNFLKFESSTSIILNVEMDHPDYYKNIQNIYTSFSKFGTNAKELCVLNEKYKSNLKITNNLTTFNFDGSADFYAKNITTNHNGLISFDCYKNNEFYGKFNLSVFGKHNVLNALAVICVADYYKIDKQFIEKGIKNFKGVKRRFEKVSQIKNCSVIHDYAHHPTEILTTINVAKQIFKNKLICVFQPHTFSRTKRLLNEFLTCFNNCDELYIFKTYPAREKSYMGVSAKQLFKKLKYTNKNVKYFSQFNEIFEELKNFIDQDCTILILGAGDIEKLAENFKLLN